MDNLLALIPDLQKFIVQRYSRQIIFRFPNNRGASIISLRQSHELAVIKWDRNNTWNIDYTSPITSDVLRNATPSEYAEALYTLAALDTIPNFFDLLFPRGQDD